MNTDLQALIAQHNLELQEAQQRRAQLQEQLRGIEALLVTLNEKGTHLNGLRESLEEKKPAKKRRGRPRKEAAANGATESAPAE